MIDFKLLDRLLFGEDGFDTNDNQPTNNKYWLDKTDEFLREAYGQQEWQFNFEKDIFYSTTSSTDFTLLLGLIREQHIVNVLQNARVDYYKISIRNTLFLILETLSKSIRTGEIKEQNSISTIIRWYVFECIKKNKKYASAFYELVNNDDVKISSVSINASNFIVNNYLVECLIVLYRQIEIISFPNNNRFSDDTFFNHVLQFNYSTTPIYNLFKERIDKSIDEFYNDKKILPHHLTKLLDILKNIGVNVFKTGSSFDFSAVENDIMVLENLLFEKYYNGLFPGENRKIEDIIRNDSDTLFDAIYSEIKQDLSKFVLPNERIFAIETKIGFLRSLVNYNEYGNTFDTVMSQPRILLSMLEIDLLTIKANPTIDIIEFDRNRIKPINVDLSVPQLALMFRLLYENNLIAVKEKTELFNTVSKAFSTKASPSISQGSVKNNFNQPDIKDYEFWKGKFLQLSRNSFKS